tara:strand:+ start:235 stop:396 length:162 start_codon:yes stop_codon:yes gene_type:complete
MKNAGYSDFSYGPVAFGPSLEVVVVEIVVEEHPESFEGRPGHVGTTNPANPKL